jgi:hypothetical protein
MMISTNVGDPKARLRSFELLAEAHPDAVRPPARTGPEAARVQA